MRKISAKWVPKCLNADQNRQRCQSSEQNLDFSRPDPNDFPSQMVTTDETWLYYYDPETKQQSMEWRHSGSPHPKYFEYKNPLEKFLPRFFRIKKASSSLVIFQGQNYQRRILRVLISAGAIEWYFEGKTPRNSPRCSCSCTTMSRFTGHLQPRRNWRIWASNVLSPTLFSGSGPVGLPPVPWTKKKMEIPPFFVRRGGHCCRGDLVGRTTSWICFKWLAKVRATGSEVYWASWGVCWINPEFGRCNFFPSW